MKIGEDDMIITMEKNEMAKVTDQSWELKT